MDADVVAINIKRTTLKKSFPSVLIIWAAISRLIFLSVSVLSKQSSISEVTDGR